MRQLGRLLLYHRYQRLRSYLQAHIRRLKSTFRIVRGHCDNLPSSGGFIGAGAGGSGGAGVAPVGGGGCGISSGWAGCSN